MSQARTDVTLVARLAEHWTSKPKVAGSIPTAIKQLFGLPGVATLRVTLGRNMDDSSYRLNFDLGKKNEIHHYS